MIITPNNWSYNNSLKITVHYHYNSKTKNIERDAKPLQNSDWQRLIRLMIRQMAKTGGETDQMAEFHIAFTLIYGRFKFSDT